MSRVVLTAKELESLDEIAGGNGDGATLQKQYAPRLLWFSRVMGVPWQDCPDVVQDVFLVAIRDIRNGRFRRDSSIITWLGGILKNKIKDLWRSLTRYRRLFAQLEPDNGDEEHGSNYAAWLPCRWDTDIDVQGVLHRMPDELRVILLLNEIDGLTVRRDFPDAEETPTVGRKLAESKRVFRQRVTNA